jgi:hypothetical protein
MSNFKNGTLVMLVSKHSRIAEITAASGWSGRLAVVPFGATGEIIEAYFHPVAQELGYIVMWSRHKSPWRNGEYWAHPSQLIPISDPDIDVTENEKQPIEENV